MKKEIWLITQKWLFTIALVVSWLIPAQAQQNPELTRASVYKLLNAVQLLLANQNPRPARQADVMQPLDALQTLARSRAELLFNEGSFLRVGSSATFRFKPGLRRIQLKNGQVVAETVFELQNGTVVAVTPPGSAGTTVELPGSGKVESAIASLPTPEGTPTLYSKKESGAFAATYDSVKKIAIVSNLGAAPIQVYDITGTQSRILKGGETVDIRNGVLGEVKTFDLNRFYATSKLAAGLGPGQEKLLLQESSQVQEIFRLVRKDTLAALQTQQRWVEGLCSLNGRSGASTLSTNCINTNDDAISTFEDRRDVVVPERQIEVPQRQPEPLEQPQQRQPEPQPQ
ncbi:hypothetical protein NIES4071_01030 [Calothrix sp. NIES-4071]|nr:hypothetical protein NIES4071_01030 [Calothrix sp. NIES-4071]BAZ54449.1 hypothetical protein NIES4105_01020 [Calothrix sp. NIES-4105]